MTETSELPERESMEFDVVIVGAGPAGLSAAIRLKQVNPELTVVVLEKGAEVGAHILSGAVVDPVGIDRLLPGWREEKGHPFTAVGVALGGLDMWTNTLLGFSFFGTLKHGKTDAQSLEPAAQHKPIAYPKPDGVLTLDRLSSVFLSNTNHEEDQPVHLKVKDMALQKASEFGVYAGPSTRYCPAGVYEWVEKDGEQTFVINAQNCVHCKTCDIKDPNQNINWVPPQGGEGPVYPNM
jgi:ferredoxin-like protein FixX